MTFSKPFVGLGLMAWFSLSAVMMPVETQATPVTVLDNTNGGTSTLSSSIFTSIFNSNKKAIVFSAGSSDYSLDKITLGLRSTNVTLSFDVKLYAVDGSNAPTGAALATQAITQALTTTPQYYTFALNLFNVVANTKYALVLENASNSLAVGWSAPNTNTLPTTYSGFSYIGYKLYSGGSWVNTVTYNAISLQASPSVPELDATSGTGALAFLAGVLVLRGENRRRGGLASAGPCSR